MSESAQAGRPNTADTGAPVDVDAPAPTLAGPSLPVLPPPAPRPSTGPPKPATPAEFFAAAVTPTVAAKPPKRRRGRAVRGLAGFIVVCGLAAGAYAGATKYLEKSGDAELPTFAAPAPTYGSVTFHVSGHEGGTSYDVQVVTDAKRSVIHLTGSAGSGLLATTELITDGQTAFVKAAETGWTRMPYAEADFGSYTDLAAPLRVSTFDDVVPASVRPYVHVIAKTPDRIGTRDVTKYELAVRMRDFKAAESTDYGTWAARVGAVDVVPDLGRFVFWVDSSGVVWQEASYSDDRTTTFESTMVDYSNDPPAIVYPTEYTDLVNPPAG